MYTRLARVPDHTHTYIYIYIYIHTHTHTHTYTHNTHTTQQTHTNRVIPFGGMGTGFVGVHSGAGSYCILFSFAALFAAGSAPLHSQCHHSEKCKGKHTSVRVLVKWGWCALVSVFWLSGVGVLWCLCLGHVGLVCFGVCVLVTWGWCALVSVLLVDLCFLLVVFLLCFWITSFCFFLFVLVFSALTAL